MAYDSLDFDDDLDRVDENPPEEVLATVRF